MRTARASSGAVIGLFQSDETEFTAENALATATSAGGRQLLWARWRKPTFIRPAHILYGGVLKNKSAGGRLLDENAYYVEIAEHGKIYEVEEREPEKALSTRPDRLQEVEKTSSDGKDWRASPFRVTGMKPHVKLWSKPIKSS